MRVGRVGRVGKVGRVGRVGKVLAASSFLSVFSVLSDFSDPLCAQSAIEVGSPAPSVTINDLEGKPFSFATFLGKRPALIEFWATWCPLCEKLLPQITAAHSRYGDRVAFVGVNVTVNQSKPRVRRYLTEHKPPFQTLWDDQGIAVRAYDVTGTSFIVIVDAAGKVAYTGYGEDQDLMKALEKVVSK